MCREKSQLSVGGDLDGIAQGVLRGHVIGDKIVQRVIQLWCLIVPGLRHNLFPVKKATHDGVLSIFDMNNARLEENKLTFPLQAVENDLYSSSLDLTRGGNGSELAMQAAANANLWHRRLEHLNRMSLDLLTNLDNNGVSFEGPVQDCDECAVGTSQQLAHSKTADHKVKLPFQLVFADLM